MHRHGLAPAARSALMPRRRLLLLAGLAAVAGGAHARLPLPFHYDLHTFRGEAGRTAVVAAFAVPAGRLHEEEQPGGTRYRFDVTLVLADTVRRTVSRTDDSVFVGFRQRPRAEHLLTTHLEVQARPSVSTVQRVIMSDATLPGVGQLYGGGFPIPDYGGGRLMLSDIVLGLPDVRGGWRRGDVTLALLPTSRMPASAFDVYYEVYNLPADRAYTTEIAVEPVGARAEPPRQPPVRLRFDGRSAAGTDATLAELRRVETSLTRGRYRLDVTVTDDASGATATRSRTFHVRGWGPGATLVPALPRTGLPGAR